MLVSHLLKLLFLFFLAANLSGQSLSDYDQYIDERDGKSYPVITIGSTVWMAQNMKYQTANSENHEDNNLGVALDGFYYPYEELDQVCPDDFRLANSSDLKKYVEYLMELKGISDSSIEFFKSKKKGDVFVGLNDPDKLLHPFEDPNPINLKGLGHTQNGKMVALGSLNFWMKYDQSDDAKYHVHMDESGYAIHTHKHHIIDKKKKLRKFSVRCVREVE